MLQPAFGSSLFSKPVVPFLWNYLCTSKFHICVLLRVTRHNCLLYDMNCYSVNSSYTSQAGIPTGRMSQIKTEPFSFTLASAPPSTSPLHLYSLCQDVILCWAPSFSPPRKVGHRPEGALLPPFPPTWETHVNMKGLHLHLTGGPSVSELIRNRPNNSSNVDELQ